MLNIGNKAYVTVSGIRGGETFSTDLIVEKNIDKSVNWSGVYLTVTCPGLVDSVSLFDCRYERNANFIELIGKFIELKYGITVTNVSITI